MNAVDDAAPGNDDCDNDDESGNGYIQRRLQQ
jgi:hypothetical protein